MDQLSTGVSLFDRYVLLERLHAGNGSEVWLADDSAADIPVALKLLAAGAAERPGRVAAFQREWQIGRSLNHPGTVRVLGWHDGARPGYAMQYIDGADLSVVCRRPFSDWAPPLAAVIDALAYWHRKGVVHGDLKAANVLLDRRGVAYLSDFGSAQTVDAPSPAARSATPAYSSPEQQAGAAPSPADDVYALARVVTELATGDPDDAGDIDEAMPAAIADLVRRSLHAADDRPDISDWRDGLAAAGVRAGAAPEAAVRDGVVRPAAAVVRRGASVAPLDAARAATGVARPAARDKRAGLSPSQVIAGLVAIVVAGVVLTWSLGVLRERQAEPAATPAAATAPAAAESEDAAAQAAETESSEPGPDPATRLQQRDAAEAILAKLLSAIDVLDRRGVTAWGGATYREARSLYEAGDRAYLAQDYALAGEQYAEALGLYEALVERIEPTYREAMQAGAEALEAGNGTAAAAAFRRALTVTPDDPEAMAGLARAEALDEVLTLVASAADAEAGGELDAALSLYSEALDIDPLWQPAADGKARVLAAIGDRAFAAAMSRGYAALNDGDYGAARDAFREAARIEPAADAPAAALQETDLIEREDRIAALASRAAAAEAAEDWIAAREAYEQMLSIDRTLDVATAGKRRVDNRIALIAAARDYIDNPDQLARMAALREGGALLARLQALEPRGERLVALQAALSRTLERAAVPVEITLRSDGETEVTVLQVARLGSFTEKSLTLRPGLYTATGTRRGFRDVRKQFRVEPGEAPGPVIIRCTDPV
jgi:hypothetical protein